MLCDHCKVLQLEILEEKAELVDENGEFGLVWDRNHSHVDLILRYERHDSFPDLPELTASAKRCVFCSSIKSAVLDLSRKLAFQTADVRITKMRINASRPVYSPELTPHRLNRLYFDIYFATSEQLESGTAEYQISASPGLTLTPLLYCILLTLYLGPFASLLGIVQRPVPDFVLAGAGQQHLRKMIDNEPGREFPTPASTYLPTRLIEVGGGPQCNNPRLVLSQDLRTKLETTRGYAALSYCWGNKPPSPLKTERNSLKQRLHAIPLNHLPLTIQDSITVCRALQITYIWIDSLCIIQDDEQDWAREAAQMANVYSNASLTICVLRGDSCHSGFLGSRKSSCIPISYTSRKAPSASGTFYLRFINVGIDDGHNFDDVLTKDTRESAWNQRAWTFQEGRLAPRKLSFGDSMAHFSCRGYQLSEDGDEIVSQRVLMARRFRKDVLREWYDTVSLYSRRVLTYQTDILPAISALARSIPAEAGGRYLAGLWSNDLFRGLLWRPVGLDEMTFDELVRARDGSDGYVAPSWSWACERRTVKWNHPLSVARLHCHVIEAETILQGSDVFGQVKGGFLCLWAKVRELGAVQVVPHPHMFQVKGEWKVKLGVSTTRDHALSRLVLGLPRRIFVRHEDIPPWAH